MPSLATSFGLDLPPDVQPVVAALLLQSPASTKQDEEALEATER